MPANPSLDQALPELRAAEERLRSRGHDNGISYVFAQYGGLRTQADTNQILAFRKADYERDVRRNPKLARVPINTYRPIAPFGRSMHNWGAAFDVLITGVPQGWTRDKALAVLGAIAPTVGLRWGGTFPSDRIDPPHFELPISVVDARARYLAYTGGKGYVGPSGPLDFLKRIFLPSSAGAQPVTTTASAPTVVLPGISVTPSRVPDILSTIGPITAAELPEESIPVEFPIEMIAASSTNGTRAPMTSRAAPSRTAPYRLPAQPHSTRQQLPSPVRSSLPVRSDVSDVRLYQQAEEIKRRQRLALIAGAFVVGVVIIVLSRNE